MSGSKGKNKASVFNTKTRTGAVAFKTGIKAITIQTETVKILSREKTVLQLQLHKVQ